MNKRGQSRSRVKHDEPMESGEFTVGLERTASQCSQLVKSGWLILVDGSANPSRVD